MWTSKLNFLFINFTIGNIFTLLAIVSFILSMIFLSHISKINKKQIIILSFILLFFGLVGTQILSFVINLLYNKDGLNVLSKWGQDRSYYGGLILNIFISLFYIKKFDLPKYKTLDIITISQVIAFAFGRFSCLSNGCCYGNPTNSDFGIKLYSNLILDKFRGINLYPTQIYEIICLLIILSVIILVFKYSKVSGLSFYLYLILYPFARFIIEFYRNNYIQNYIIYNISISQFISIIIFITALTLLVFHLKNNLKK